MAATNMCSNFGSKWPSPPLKGGLYLKPTKVTHICSCHNFFPLSSAVQIIIIPACYLLCVL